MSNPGVLPLAHIMLDNNVLFHVEDNIGEAIHVHWGNLRIDFTIEEFFKFVDVMTEAMNGMIGVQYFDIKSLNSLFLYNSFTNFIHLDSARFEKIRVQELLLENVIGSDDSHCVSLSDSWMGKICQLHNFFDVFHSATLEDQIIIDEKNCILDGIFRAMKSYLTNPLTELTVLRMNFSRKVQNRRMSDIYIRKIIYLIVKCIIPTVLKGRKIILKGAGVHSQRLIEDWGDSVDITGIIAKDGNNLGHIPLVDLDSLDDTDNFCIVISSWKYRKEMINEMKDITNIELFDIYGFMEELGIYLSKEYYRYDDDYYYYWINLKNYIFSDKQECISG